MHLYQPFVQPPKKWCGCYVHAWCNHGYYHHPLPSTTATLKWPEPDDGYVGRHRKPEE